MTDVLNQDWYCPKCRTRIRPGYHTDGDDGERLYLNCGICSIRAIVTPKFKE